tara:strand:- start:1057 stop:3132 length:2076 start_codon:yes stop_codon:yes gene_type:complete
MPNHLSGETSLYLLDHQSQPVNWYPWGENALAIAKEQNKPILLSIGYATNPWCELMAKESFADPATAQIMNEHFINIKVDREERPDLDKIYQSALQLLNKGNGGWPLTVVIDPQNLTPFFGGSYFSKDATSTMPGFADLLMRLHQAFTDQAEDLRTQAAKMAQAVKQMYPPLLDPNMPDADLVFLAKDQVTHQFDESEGGFGQGPKFAMTSRMQGLLRHWAIARRHKDNDKIALEVVMTTLTKIARGGIYDHLGGGFFRYTTDRAWRTPYFEKVLCDNAQLLSIFAEALRLGPDPLFQDAISDTIKWLMADMRHAKGGFYASQDALLIQSNETAVGKYYLWRREEVKKHLKEDEYLLVETLYGIDRPANLDNHWSLHRSDSYRSVVERLSMQVDAANEVLASAKEKLFLVRQQRSAPRTDETILTAWNGLLISGLVEAGTVMQRPDWIATAEELADFIFTHCWDGKLLTANWRNSGDRSLGFSDDYANVLMGLLDLLQYRWREQDAAFAVALADAVISGFYDTDNGGFFFSHKDQEDLIFRPKPTLDESVPPGNATLALALNRLGHLLGKNEYLDVATNTLRWARAIMEQFPSSHYGLITALEDANESILQIVLRGPIEEMQGWKQVVGNNYAPWRSCYAIPFDDIKTIPSYLPGLVSSETKNKVSAYIYDGEECSKPITDLELFKKALIS